MRMISCSGSLSRWMLAPVMVAAIGDVPRATLERMVRSTRPVVAGR